MNVRSRLSVLFVVAISIPVFTFGQEPIKYPDPVNVDGVWFIYDILSDDGTQFKARLATDAEARELNKKNRGDLTDPVLTLPLPPRQTLPPNIPRIPLQTPIPANPNLVQNVTCVFSGLLNRSYTCTYTDINGKTTTKVFYEYSDPLHVTERSLPNPDFVAINALNTNNQTTIRVPFDMATLRPANPVPLAYPSILKQQMDANKVLLGDYKTPLPNELAFMRYNGPNGVMLFLLPGIVNGGATTLRTAPRLPLPAVVAGGMRPCRPNFGNGGFPSIEQIMQGQAGPAALPVQPLPSTGGLGEPPGGGGTVTAGGGALGSFTDFWSQNGVLGNIQWSLYFEIPIVKWGGGQAAVPPPGMTPDGKAYNVYFALNGIPFAISFTDLNNDGVYESHILQLTGDPKNPNLAGIAREFKTYEEFTQFVEQLRRTPKPSSPPTR